MFASVSLDLGSKATVLKKIKVLSVNLHNPHTFGFNWNTFRTVTPLIALLQRTSIPAGCFFFFNRCPSQAKNKAKGQTRTAEKLIVTLYVVVKLSF